jgi:hypothetical protein
MTEETTPTTAEAAKEAPGYTVRNFLDPATLKKDISYSTNNLNDAMMTQASMFVHYGMLYAEASRQVDVVQLLLDNTESAVYRLLRKEAADAGEKVTEALLEKMVTRHPRVNAMRKSLYEAKYVEANCKSAVEGFRHRKDMLVQQGAQSREEMKGEIRIREASVRDEAIDAKKQAFLQGRT